MVENLGRMLTIIAVFLTTALTLLLLPDKPFRMGLDLQGGTRLVYSLDFTAAIAEGRISADESEQELIQQTMRIVRNRIDPSGVLEPIIRQEGDNIAIEIPGSPEFADEVITSSLAKRSLSTRHDAATSITAARRKALSPCVSVPRNPRATRSMPLMTFVPMRRKIGRSSLAPAMTLLPTTKSAWPPEPPNPNT